MVKYKLEPITGLSREQMKLQAVGKFNYVFANMTVKEMEEYFTICTTDILGSLNKSVEDKVKKAKEEGFHTVLLSGTYDRLLKNFQNFPLVY